jgi:hypothetical protein
MVPCQLITPLLVGLVGGVAGQGLGTLSGRTRFPRLPPSDIGRAADVIRSLVRRGLRPATTSGPFGNLVVGTADQDLPLLGEEAAIRQINQEVLREVLTEDPLLFIRNLPPGDPRRVAVGLDPPNLASRIAPSPGSPETIASTLSLAIRSPTTAPPRLRTLVRSGRGFSRRLSVGRFAVR